MDQPIIIVILHLYVVLYDAEFNKILIDELKLLFLRVRNPSDNSLEILLKTIDPTISLNQLKDYITICRGKFSDFRYNYKGIILKKARDLEIHFSTPL
ncbi:uncharacterized protein OCT59_007194 [Rhizophagus irregularis]|uniref:uncharacterized protein n=1 Tax=Rhizophagus irregularis TaxID=588596 RepID=UPI00332F9C3E|nr:hypothetical protein OCT59_007194 [Rhizophagus irregularis]